MNDEAGFQPVPDSPVQLRKMPYLAPVVLPRPLDEPRRDQKAVVGLILTDPDLGLSQMWPNLRQLLEMLQIRPLQEKHEMFLRALEAFIISKFRRCEFGNLASGGDIYSRKPRM